MIGFLGLAPPLMERVWGDLNGFEHFCDENLKLESGLDGDMVSIPTCRIRQLNCLKY